MNLWVKSRERWPRTNLPCNLILSLRFLKTKRIFLIRDQLMRNHAKAYQSLNQEIPSRRNSHQGKPCPPNLSSLMATKVSLLIRIKRLSETQCLLKVFNTQLIKIRLVQPRRKRLCLDKQCLPSVCRLHLIKTTQLKLLKKNCQFNKDTTP